MSVTIPADLSPHVDMLISTGNYASTDAVVRDALTKLLERHHRVELLRLSIQDGIAEYERGECTPFDFAEMKRKAREAWLAEGNS